MTNTNKGGYLRRRNPSRWMKLSPDEERMAARIVIRVLAMLEAQRSRGRLNHLDAISTQIEAAGLQYHSQQYYLIGQRVVKDVIEGIPLEAHA